MASSVISEIPWQLWWPCLRLGTRASNPILVLKLALALLLELPITTTTTTTATTIIIVIVFATTTSSSYYDEDHYSKYLILLLPPFVPST